MINAFFLAILAIFGFLTAYFVYGKFIAVKILELNPNNKTPAVLKEDGQEYVPTHKNVLFGHHFASIAGLGPILGPAIAVIWGWLPAVLWVFFGTIFLGAVHDLVALGISLKHEGRSIGDITSDVIGSRARLLFLLIIFFALALAMGVFALVIATLFSEFYPQAVIPTFSLIIVAVIVGISVYKFQTNLTLTSIIGFSVIMVTLYIGTLYPVSLYQFFISDDTYNEIQHADEQHYFSQYCLVTDYGDYSTAIEKSTFGKNIHLLANVKTLNVQAQEHKKIPITWQALIRQNVTTMTAFFSAEKIKKDLNNARSKSYEVWVWSLLAYALIASILPVWLLLQPRDYLNSFQLYLGCFLMYLGLFIGAGTLKIVAPAINPNVHFFSADSVTGIPAMFPFLFITIACGAISGFHCLVSSGTTVRQVKNENDALLIGYGGMLTEGALAIVVILACTAGFSSEQSWNYFYRNWEAASGLGAKMAAFINGAGFFIHQLGIPLEFSKTLVAVIVVGFAMTTLDSATRLLRYNIEELGTNLKIQPIRNKYSASLIAVLVIGFFAFMKIDGKPAGLTLWKLFGTTNQLLAGIALLVVTIYLYGRKKPIIYTLLPMVFILTMAVFAMVINWLDFIEKKNTALILVGGILLAMTIWLCCEAGIKLHKVKKSAREATCAE